MPMYEYQCSNCHQIVDQISRVGQTSSRCPNCGSRMTKTSTIHKPAVVYHGSGFYSTDSKDDGDVPK